MIIKYKYGLTLGQSTLINTNSNLYCRYFTCSCGQHYRILFSYLNTFCIITFCIEINTKCNNGGLIHFALLLHFALLHSVPFQICYYSNPFCVTVIFLKKYGCPFNGCPFGYLVPIENSLSPSLS